MNIPTDTSNRHTTQRNYDRLSRWYDLFSGSERRFTSAGLTALNLRAGEQVLEIGFGTGRALVAMAQAVIGSGHVYGIDLSPGMLKKAEKLIRRAGVAETVTLQTGDAACLPFPDGMFDAVFMGFTLELFSAQEIPIVLKECRRVLKPGGRLGIVSLAKKDIFAVRVYEWFHTRLPTLIDCRPIRPGEVLPEAGFRVDNTLTKTMWGLPVEIVLARQEEKVQ